ncbi:hypothetical protein [Sulfurovum sp.]|uniref:hypothetical protein n=1 Tax=Sulfurovum sp. TaxID=1969726 RepID=UPI0025FD1968|nr:hypothetical protein [Sulfurovum sp.]
MPKEKEELFKKIGVDISDEKIDIDLVKTKDFFNTLQDKLQKKAESIQQDVLEGKIDLKDDIGIKVDDEHMDIDLKKTKSFIEAFGTKIEHFLAELDRTAEQIAKKPEEK